MDRESAVRELRERIGAYLRGDTTYSQFERAYVEFFVDESADEAFTDSDHDLYGSLFERLQWTSSEPSGLERASGYSSISDTDAWIRERFRDLA